jgi:uncharacterized protein YbcC (UPF0753/DUF2309 family)
MRICTEEAMYTYKKKKVTARKDRKKDERERRTFFSREKTINKKFAFMGYVVTNAALDRLEKAA